MKLLLSPQILVALAFISALAGCGGGFAVAPTTGKVVANGQPVTSGSVTFIPLGGAGSLEAGKPASGAIKPDGTFSLSTFNRFDGAIVGKHRVEYTGSEDESSEEEGSTSEETTQTATATKKPKTKYVLNAEMIVEVKSGGPNDFTIEVQPVK